MARTHLLALAAILALGCPAEDDKDPTDPTDTDVTDTEVGDSDPVDTDVVEIPTERPPNPTCVAPERPANNGSAGLQRMFQGVSLSSPLAMVQAPGDPSWWYVIEQAGRVYRFENNPNASGKDLVLDITSEVNSAASNEMGLLGIAFHPDFATNGELFLSYTAGSGGPWSGNQESRISRFVSSDGGQSVAANTEGVVLVVDQPYTNHNGGNIAFGPDGLLYVGLGDGGSGGDPDGNGQDPTTLLGSMLRIDVDSGNPYGIPADNPFAGGGAGAPEVWAWGLRNPWRWTFDRFTGDLWAGDVGQDAYEEVDVIVAGGNYGWNIVEGYTCFISPNCTAPGLEPPVIDYSQPPGSSSVIGGYVYRGSGIPSLFGVYLYAEFYTGEVFGIFRNAAGEAVSRRVASGNLLPASFAEDADGELYLVDYDGRIFAITPPAGTATSTFPQRLSETGCVDPADPSTLVDALLPYQVAHPFWSDGLGKGRWLAIPDGTEITIDAEGDWEMPAGSMLMKSFTDRDGAPLETRFMVRHDDGDWGGYTYRWVESEGDGFFVPEGTVIELPDQTWTVPSQTGCPQCHTAPAGRSLGLETANMNVEVTTPSGGVNQVAWLAELGILASDPGSDDVFAGRDSADPVDDKARAYLHVNCSSCHRPGATGGGDIDLRASIPFADMGLCNVEPAKGGPPGAPLLAPGDAEGSVLSFRLHDLAGWRMPPLGSSVIDTVGTAIIDDWIESITDCP